MSAIGRSQIGICQSFWNQKLIDSLITNAKRSHKQIMFRAVFRMTFCPPDRIVAAKLSREMRAVELASCYCLHEP